MHEWSSDVIHAWRRLRAAPSFTLFSVLTLALGIGATTAVYSVVYAAVLRPPDIRDIDRVANVYHADPRRRGSGVSFISALACRLPGLPCGSDQLRIPCRLAGVPPPAGRQGKRGMVDGGSGRRRVLLRRRHSPALGRVIQPADDTTKAPRVIVLSDSLWRTTFRWRIPAIVGRTVKLGGETFEVIGVAPPAFRGVGHAERAADSRMDSTVGCAGLQPRERHGSRTTDGLREGTPAARPIDGRRHKPNSSAIAHRLDLAYPIGTKLDSRFRSPHSTSRPWLLLPAASVKMHESVDRLARPACSNDHGGRGPGAARRLHERRESRCWRAARRDGTKRRCGWRSAPLAGGSIREQIVEAGS